jgi:gamma-glutamylputrescine oxidase
MAAERYDVAIVGGGLAGVVAAYEVAASGAKAIVLERGALGGGASGRSAGLVLTGIADHASRLGHGVGRDEAATIWRFSADNGEVIREIVKRHKIACGYEPCGSYAVAINPAEDHDLRETAALLISEDAGVDATYLDEDALARERHPPRGLGALKYVRDAAVDGAALVRGIAAALPPGATVREGAEVRALEAGEQGVRLELAASAGAGTSAGAVEAEVAIVAANARAPEVASFFEGLIWPVRGQGFVTAPLPRLLAAGVSAGWGHESYRQLRDGRIVAMGFRPEPAEDDMSFDETPTDLFQGFLAKFAAERIPGFPPSPPVERRFAGTCGFAKDALPLLGPLPGQPKVVAACGFTMRGLSLGAAVGRAAAHLVLDGVRDFPASFLPSRFL